MHGAPSPPCGPQLGGRGVAHPQLQAQCASSTPGTALLLCATLVDKLVTVVPTLQLQVPPTQLRLRMVVSMSQRPESVQVPVRPFVHEPGGGEQTGKTGGPASSSPASSSPASTSLPASLSPASLPASSGNEPESGRPASGRPASGGPASIMGVPASGVPASLRGGVRKSSSPSGSSTGVKQPATRSEEDEPMPLHADCRGSMSAPIRTRRITALSVSSSR